MTDDTTPGRNGNDMIIEPVELIPDTGDDDNEIGEPFWVKYRTEEGLKTHHMRMVRVDDDSMEPELREGEWVVVDLASRRPEAGGKFLIRLGESLVARWAEAMPGDAEEEQRLRLIPANPAYAPCFARKTSRSSARWSGRSSGRGGEDACAPLPVEESGPSREAARP